MQALILALAVLAQPGTPAAPQPPVDWKPLEKPLLVNHLQLTSREKFLKAGEAYFSHDGQAIIFQAILAPDQGETPSQFYTMFVASLDRSADGRATGISNITRLSKPGAADTCGWFHPTEPGVVIFGSTIEPPKPIDKPGFQVGTNRYIWSFPQETDVCRLYLSQLVDPQAAARDSRPPAEQLKPAPLFTRPGYDAECSFDKSGRFVLYANVDPAKQQEGAKPDADIWIYDTKTNTQRPIVVAPGYDGGPFFSPDGAHICYRSDRAGNDLLQIYVSKLRFEKDESGTPVPVGIEDEYQVTANEHVNWCPTFHPSGRFLVYASSQISHRNYEVLAIAFRPDLASSETVDQSVRTGSNLKGDLRDLRTRVIKGVDSTRVTHADGADVLPAFSDDARFMMWTSQRGPKVTGEDRPSSQLWIAELVKDGPWTSPSDQNPIKK
jgi:TolB protein